MALTQVDQGLLGTYAQYTGFKNKLINGQMQIDQRNAGASGTAIGYTVDRWQYSASQASKVTWQQNAGSVTPPPGFSNYLGFTSSSSYSSLSSDYFVLVQRIEGFNTADLAFGTNSALTTTLSFWVRSSLTGTFGGSYENSANNRSYVFSYVINSANTWEYKTVTIPGDTTGTWVGATNGQGLKLWFDLGNGTTYKTTAGSWVSGDYQGVTGGVNLVGTSGATWYITGVQLEKGSTATSFDYRPYGTELQLCQRYFAKIYGSDSVYIATKYTTSKLYTTFTLPVTPRATPSVTIPSGGYYAADYNAANVDSNPSVSSVDTTEFGSNVNVIWNISWNPAGNYICRVGANTATNLWFSMEL